MSTLQVAEIAGSIREFGWTNPVLVDGDNGIIAATRGCWRRENSNGHCAAILADSCTWRLISLTEDVISSVAEATDWTRPSMR